MSQNVCVCVGESGACIYCQGEQRLFIRYVCCIGVRNVRAATRMYNNCPEAVPNLQAISSGITVSNLLSYAM